MRGAQHQRADVRQVEPERQFPPDRAAGLPVAAAGHDLHAAQPLGMGGAQESCAAPDRRAAPSCRADRACAPPAACPRANRCQVRGIEPAGLAADAQRRDDASVARARDHRGRRRWSITVAAGEATVAGLWRDVAASDRVGGDDRPDRRAIMRAVVCPERCRPRSGPRRAAASVGSRSVLPSATGHATGRGRPARSGRLSQRRSCCAESCR